MAHPTDAIVTGFVKSPDLLALSLEPLRTLKHEGVIRNIHYVTWDSADIDPCVAPLSAMPDIDLVRVPQPEVQGTGNQRGVVYQVRNLEAALDLVDNENTVVLKTRPDFIVDINFLRNKIASFEDWSVVPNERIGAHLPEPALHNKIWVPWADSNQPFFYEDAAFMGRKRDLKKLVTQLTPRDLEVLGERTCGWFAHVVRYARIFAPRYAIFARYLQHFQCFVNNVDYRGRQLGTMLGNSFFWHLLIAHAWILYSQFHVDAGEQGDVIFYPNAANRDADWAKPQTLRVGLPYNDIAGWREGTKPHSALLAVQRIYGRLMDDAWQEALFTDTQPDLPEVKLTEFLHNIAHYRDGRFAEIETAFYAQLAAFHRENWSGRGGPDHVVQVAGAGGQHHQPVEAHRHAG